MKWITPNGVDAGRRIGPERRASIERSPCGVEAYLCLCRTPSLRAHIAKALGRWPIIQVSEELYVSGAVPRSSRIYRDERVLAGMWGFPLRCDLLQAVNRRIIRQITHRHGLLPECRLESSKMPAANPCRRRLMVCENRGSDWPLTTTTRFGRPRSFENR
jgi:hypothetical protein